MNRDAPPVDTATAKAIQLDEFLRLPDGVQPSDAELLWAAAHAGWRGGQGAELDESKSNWIRRHSQNTLRITRELKCLLLLGMGKEARHFQRALARLRKEELDHGINSTPGPRLQSFVEP